MLSQNISDRVDKTTLVFFFVDNQVLDLLLGVLCLFLDFFFDLFFNFLLVLLRLLAHVEFAIIT